MKSLTAFLGAVGMVCCYEMVCAQVSTVKDGNWNSPSTWSGGVVPNSTHGVITIAHAVVTSGIVLTVDEIVLQNSLTIENDAEITLSYSGKSTSDFQIISGGILNVYGKISCLDGARFSGTNLSNTFFQSGAIYEHRYSTSAGEPPVAFWDINSTLNITGYRTNHSLNTAGWIQSFGNVEYNCPNQQAEAFVEMLGNLKTIQGNFHIRNTNGGILRLTLDRTTLNTINIGGNFIIDGNSEVWFSREANTIINIGGNFEYRSTATPSSYLTTKGTCQVNVNGSVLVNTRGLLRFASSGGGTGTLRVKKNFNFQSGSLAVEAPGRGIIECNGDGQQFITCNESVSPNIIFMINNSSGVELTSNSIGQSSLHVMQGELVLPATFSLQNNLILGESGSLKSNETTLQLSGSLEQTLDLQRDTLRHVMINKSAGSSVTLSSMLNLWGNLSIQSQNTAFHANGNLTLLSASDDGNADASIGFLPAGSQVIGDVTVQRFMSGEGRIYRYLSSPVTNASVASMQDDFPVTGLFENPSVGSGINSKSPSLYWYDEKLIGLSGWVPYPVSGLSQNNMLTVGRGYTAFIRLAAAPTIWDVTGPINQGEINLQASFAKTDDSVNDGWNLIGNPYPSSIDWDNEVGWIKTNVANGITIRNNGTGSFMYWDGDLGSLGNGRIAKGQAFWIRTNGTDPSLIINENAKTNLTTPFLKKSAADLDYIELVVSSTTLMDKAYLRLRSDAHPKFDAADVQKMNNDFINLAFLADSIPLAIAATNMVTCDSAVPVRLSFAATSTGSILPSMKGDYTFSYHTAGLFNSSTISIYDSFTHTSTLFKERTYIFSVTDDPASYANDRFSLYIEAENSIEALLINYDSVFCLQNPYFVRVEIPSGEVRSTLFVNGSERESVLLSDSIRNEIVLDPYLFSNDVTNLSIVMQNACHVHVNEWQVSSFKEPVITQQKNRLASSYSNGNQWYFENRLIGDLQTIEPEQSGVYTVRVNSEGCDGESTYDFLYQANEVLLFPNPVQDNINVTSPLDAVVTLIRITDTSGKLIKEIRPDAPFKYYSISLAELTTGFYLANVYTSKGFYPLKLIKE